MNFSMCPRCGSRGFERLKSHAHCVECNFFEMKETESEMKGEVQAWLKDIIGNELALIERAFNCF